MGGYSSRKNCWSGTPYGILEALKNRTEVEDISLHYKKQSLIEKIFSCIWYGNSFLIKETRNGVREINDLKLPLGDPCLVFLEYVTNNVKDTYVYQDCTVDYIVRLKESGKLISKWSPLPNHINNRAITKRLSITREFYQECRGIFTMSQWLADDLISNSFIDKNKVHCVGGGCNIDTYKVDTSKKCGNKFLFVGKDWERKNGPLVIEAFKKVKEEFPDTELYIAGPESIGDASEIRGIYFIGRKSYEELVYYYNLCDYFVMPSQFEAYGIVFAEALIFGLPCIGKNCFAMPEFIIEGDNGYLIEQNDPEELFYKMIKMLNNQEMVSRVISKHDLYVQQYSWDSVVGKMIEVFRTDGYEI